ncbi:response regulator transcription factor [Rhodovulum tesquicola]|uniref:LuxR family two component transcriptional regulator n=1 Tax=Rhodovulum steppense TaxID=540251 RepID=A0A4R1YWC6_9RHOB|nr:MULTISPECIES: response regulator transcription factor [Rhodovulum]MCO8145910.1 response regulator transcription factor [Rhodovulum tesquicola]TCM85455.1 LuxR family two component transcriptional regulator [Rhodovulum steppense]
MLRVLIADDHDLVRETLALYLDNAGGFDLTLAADLDRACKDIERHAGFDLVLLDYAMPGMNGLEGLKRALDVNSGKAVALMSGIATRQTAHKAMDAGAIGFLPKTMAANSLVNAIRFMCSGEKYVPVDFLSGGPKGDEPHPLARSLTRREMQVLEGLCRGLANKEIARKLDLREVTIKLHVKSVCKKLDANNRTHAAMIAKAAGLF